MRLLLAAACALLVGTAPRAAAQLSTAALDDSTTQALRALGLSGDGVEFRGFYKMNETATIAAGDTVRGPVFVLRGDADIRGTVLGNVAALFGDVVVRDGADVHGSAAAYRGRVIIEGGRVRGPLGARPVAVAEVAKPPRSTADALTLAGGWGAMILIVGLLALVLAGPQLDETARLLEQNFSKAFFVGVAAEIGFLPLLLFVVVALAVTVVGFLLIPFALVAAPVALAGLVTLGWLAGALLIGRAAFKGSMGNDRSALLRTLIPGAVVLFAPWVLAAAMQSSGGTAVIVRAAAFGVTWVAATAGLGAVLIVRASAKRKSVKPAASAGGWQTPTPIGGIATARRPVPARPEASAKS
jgi:hypothetical protein